MNIATVLFTYKRSFNTKTVLDALERNTLKPEILYIFQDGCRNNNEQLEWNETNKIINDVSWCNCKIIVSDENQGLSKSIISGLNYIFKFHDAAIILEDDCVPHPLFMEYMYMCLKKYAEDDKVFTVNGYACNIAWDNYDRGVTAYFSGRTSSWGWGIWRNRWKEYEYDFGIINRIKKNPESCKRLHIWGEDLEGYLLDTLEGKADSWAVFLALKVIEKGKYCVTPYYSFINNIGFDGSGVHCADSIVKQKLRPIEEKSEIILPDKIEIFNETEKKYKSLFAWTAPEIRKEEYNKILLRWIKLYQQKKSIGDYLQSCGIKNVSIWGMGAVGKLLIEEIKGKVEIDAIIIGKVIYQKVEGNIPVISISEIKETSELIIVVPVYDIERIKKEAEEHTDCPVVALDVLIDECFG